MSQAISTESTGYESILSAIYDIALNHAGISFAGGKKYELPLPGEMDAAGAPFLAVRAGDLASWAVGGTMGDDMRIPGSIEPVWEFEVYAIFPYTDANQNHQNAADALVQLIAAFTLNFDLEATCASAEIVAGPQKTGLTYLSLTGDELNRAAKLTIRAYETLMVRYA